MINKKFLSKVLEKKVLTIKSMTKKTIHYKYANGSGSTEAVISIHDLAHKCKELVVLDGYGLSSYPVKKYLERSIEKWICQVMFFGQPVFFIEDTSEPEVIFKACKIIFDKKD
jgi:hypothetical protein